MQKVEQIEQQIQQLSPTEFAELREWLLAKDWKAWGAQIEIDSRSDRLDNLPDDPSHSHQ